MKRRGLLGLLGASAAWAQNKIFREPEQPKYIMVEKTLNLTALVEWHSVLVYERAYSYSDGTSHLTRYQIEVPKGNRYNQMLWPGDRVVTLKGWRVEPIRMKPLTPFGEITMRGIRGLNE